MNYNAKNPPMFKAPSTRTAPPPLAGREATECHGGVLGGSDAIAVPHRRGDAQTGRPDCRRPGGLQQNRRS